MSFFLENQQPLLLAKVLGSGGEGTVYALPNQPNVVAKIYHQAPTVRKQAKLTAMVLGCDAELEKIALWPKALVYDAHQQIVGFLMPRLPASSLAIHHLYNPGQRKKDFPQADYEFLIHSARNMAAAFAVLHRHGHSVGDVNQGNLVVAPDATVKLIDCDSFQIKTAQSVFVCEVGVAHFTPPELHGKSFGDIETIASHDNFGLAILIFHLLMMGRHPFAGVYVGEGEMSIEKAITEFRYAYSQQNTQTQMKLPPKAPRIDWLPQDIQRLFEEAFDAEVEKRPSAATWLLALESFKQQLITCRNVVIHKHNKNLKQCPWCEFASKYRIEFFLANGLNKAPNQTFEATPEIPVKNIKQQIYLTAQIEPLIGLPEYLSKNNMTLVRPNDISRSFWGVYLWVFIFGVSVLKNIMPIPIWLFLVVFAGFLISGILWLVIQHVFIFIKSMTGVGWPLDVWLTSSQYIAAKQSYWQKKAQVDQFRAAWLENLTKRQKVIDAKKAALSLCDEYSSLLKQESPSKEALKRITYLAATLPTLPKKISQDIDVYKENIEESLSLWQVLNTQLRELELIFSANGETLIPEEPLDYIKKDVLWLWFWILLIPNIFWFWLVQFSNLQKQPLNNDEWVRIDSKGQPNNNAAYWSAVLDVKQGLLWEVDKRRRPDINGWRLPKSVELANLELAANKFGSDSILQLMPNLAEYRCFWVTERGFGPYGTRSYNINPTFHQFESKGKDSCTRDLTGQVFVHDYKTIKQKTDVAK